MALNGGHEVNPKLLALLRDGGTSGRSVAAIIGSAFSRAPDPVLIKLIIDLRALIPHLDEWKSDAVQAIVSMDWSKKSEEVIDEHCQLLVSIAAAHACHQEHVLRFFVKRFLTASPSGDASEQDGDGISDISRRCWDAAHKGLALILEILPTCERFIVKILRDTFPFMKRPVGQLRDYTRNLLVIVKYAPNSRMDILRIIVEELVKIDTTCSHEALESAASESSASSSDMEVFHMEAESSHHNAPKGHFKEILDLRTKLDVCMYDFFKYLASLRDRNEELSSTYTSLLTIFESTVLPVYSSHHIQFLWFVMCSYDEKLSKHFLNWLWLHVQTPSILSTIRQNAASYLASYLARASYLDVDAVVSCLKTWTSWIHGYISNQEGAGGKENASIHSTFYAVCQAAFYVIGFRAKEILAMRNGHDVLKSLNLDRVVTCRLNPLKYCSEKVVINFANISRNYQFAFCYTILERNRRSSFFEQRRSGLAPNQLLECFFPFDPFLLPKSLEFVTPVYREYEEGHFDSGPSAEMAIASRKNKNDEDDIDDFLEDELMESSSPSRRIDAGSFEMISPSAREMMFSYSVSPGFKHG